MTLRPQTLRALAVAAAITLASPAVFAQATVSAQASAGDATATHDHAGHDDARAAAARDLHDRHCLRHTGSRVHMRTVARAADADADASVANGRAASRRDCLAVNGRVYSRDDIDRTGRVDIGDALRALDPAIR